MSTKKKSDKPNQDWKITKDIVKHIFTQDERIEKGLEANREYIDAANLEIQLGGIKKDFQSKIESATMRHNVALGKMQDGFEMRPDTECVTDYNSGYDPTRKTAIPKPGRKILWLHLGNGKRGEFVREEAMTESDLQRDLPLRTPASAAPSPGEPLNPVKDAFVKGQRKRGKQRVIEAQIVDEGRQLNAPPEEPAATLDEPAHVTQPTAGSAD